MEDDNVKGEEDDDVKGRRMMMLRMMMWRRRRKMMMLRIMMWRRRTDPKTATHTVCEPARSKSTWRFHKSHLIRKFTSKMPRTSCGPKPRHTHIFCASLRNRHTLGNCTRIARAHLQGKWGKCRAPKPGHTLCASLRNQNSLGDFTRATLYENFTLQLRFS